MKKYAKQTFFNNLEFNMQDFNASNPRQYWKMVKMLVKDNSGSCNTIPPLQKNDNTYTLTDTDKADILNDYFVSISSVDDSNVVYQT